MKTAEFRAKTKDELEQSLIDLRREQFNFRFQSTTGKLDNPSRVRAVRRDIARVKTVLNEQKSGKSPVAAKAAKKPAAKKKTKE